jgi:ceramide glucosyltransferase
MTGSILLLLALSVLVTQLVTVALFLRRLKAGRLQPGTLGLPRVTLLRPVCGHDAFDDETIGSSFRQDYPDYEIIFCAPSESDPSVPLVRRLIEAHPKVSARLLIGETAITGNPKLNNLWKGWRAAEAEWVCMTDSNLMLPPGYLRTVVSAWGPDTGLVSSPPVGERPDGLAASLECAFLNGNQARLQFAADSVGQGFAQGKTLFWNREMLNRAGGLGAIGHYLAEDVNSTKLVHELGLKVSLTPLPFAQPIGRRRFAQVWDRQLRWSRVRRDGFPMLFATEICNGPAAALVALWLSCILLHLPVLVIGLFLAAWYGSEVYLMRRAGWPARWRDILALPLRDLLIPLLWGATFLNRTIEWRGTAMAPSILKEAPVLDVERA